MINHWYTQLEIGRLKSGKYALLEITYCPKFLGGSEIMNQTILKRFKTKKAAQNALNDEIIED